MTTITSAALIVNAQSRKGQEQFAAACAAMKGLPFKVDARAVKDPAKLMQTARDLLAKGPDLFIIGGGDGTISGLVDELVGADAMLGVLPFGTANSFARTLCIPLDLEGAVAVLRDGAPRRIDLGMIDDDYFANCAAIGISPLIAETIPNKLKRVLGRIGYLGWATAQFFRFRPFKLIVEADGREHRLDALEVRIANGPYHGGTWLVDEAAPDTGRIAVQAVTGRAKRYLLRNWAASVVGSEWRGRDVVTFQGESLRVRTEPPLPISIDGEVLAKTPVTAKIARGIIRVMAPREAAEPGRCD